MLRTLTLQRYVQEYHIMMSGDSKQWGREGRLWIKKKKRMPMSLITVASKTENYQIITLALQVSDRPVAFN